jgi:DNA repair exonuclease SbcCD ATPase subunit
MSNNAKPIALQTDNEKAVSAFEGFLTPEEEQLEESEVEAEEQDEDLVEEAEEEIEEDLEEDIEDLDSEEVEEDAEEIEEDLEQPEQFTVKIDGIEQEVTLEELKNGYSRQQDYTRKTQELSEQKKTVSRQLQEISEKDAIYAELLPRLEAQLEELVGNEPDWNQLYEEDPTAYVRERQLWDEKKDKLSKVQAEKQRLEQENLAKRQEQIKQIIEEGNQKLSELIPEWQKSEVKQKEITDIRNYAVNSLGFNQEEMDAIVDYRVLNGLRQAWLYGQTLEATKKKPTQKASKKIARPGSSNKPVKTSAIKKERQRLAKTGRVQDAARVFEQLLK